MASRIRIRTKVPNSNKYVVVADGGAARILHEPESGDPRRKLEEVARLERASAHQPARELTTDRTGRVFDSGGRTGMGPQARARHGAQSDYDPHAVEVERFARRVARQLDAERSRRRIDELVVIAEPRFLGVLRPRISAPTRRLVTREIPRDLVRAQPAQIRRAAFAPQP